MISHIYINKMQRNFFVDCAIQLMIAVLKNPQVINQKLNSELITNLIYSIWVSKQHLIKTIMLLYLLWVELREKHQSCGMCVSVSALDLCNSADGVMFPTCPSVQSVHRYWCFCALLQCTLGRHWLCTTVIPRGENYGKVGSSRVF